jgi:hypothetical protein
MLGKRNAMANGKTDLRAALRRPYYSLRHWLRSKYRPPVVVISYGGQRTPRPQVHVSVAGINGLQGVYTWDADSIGNAKATMYGEGLARIMQRRIVDERKTDSFVPAEPPHRFAENVT